MKFTTIQDFTSLTDLLRVYGDADEIVFKSHCDMDESEIAEACRRGRRLAHHLRLQMGAKSAGEIAAGFGCEIVRESWKIAEGKLVFFAECSLDRSKSGATIRVNSDAIKSLADFMIHWADESERGWFSESKIDEAVIAHELFHLIEQRPPSTILELSAHAFARAFAALPFSPLLYNALLVRLMTGKRTLSL